MTANVGKSPKKFKQKKLIWKKVYTSLHADDE